MRSLRVALHCVLLAIALVPATVQAQAYTDAELLANGQAAWDKDQCVQASKFLFAYSQRNQAALQANPGLRDGIQTIIQWCEKNAVVAADFKADCPGCPKPVQPQVALLQLVPVPVIDPKARRARVYATIAVAQNQANQDIHCGFSGGRWDSNYSYHYDWALAVAATASRAETQQRQLMLSQCAP